MPVLTHVVSSNARYEGRTSKAELLFWPSDRFDSRSLSHWVVMLMATPHHAAQLLFTSALFDARHGYQDQGPRFHGQVICK